MLAFGTTSAQFKVAEKQKMPEIVWQNGFNHLKLYKQETSNGIYIYFISIRTTNQFDEKMLIYLGDKEKSIATFSQLLNDLYIPNELYELVDARGEAFNAKCGTLNEYIIIKRGYAGEGHILLGQLRKMQSALIKM